MKATGIVRRIDDLGRVVIPKEIRRTMRIREGDPLEIYTDKDGQLIVKKYSPIGELSDYASDICESLKKSTEGIAAVCDRDSVIAISGGARRELLDKPNSEALGKLMEQRKYFRYEAGSQAVAVTDGADKYHVGVAAPILCQGDLMGCVMLLLGEGDAPLAESDQKLARTVADFLGKQMES